MKAELFSKYRVLQEAEVRSRVNAYMEKYEKQLLIESETMILIGRQMILPAAHQHQTRLAEAIHATQAAGVDCDDQKAALQSFVDACAKTAA